MSELKPSPHVVAVCGSQRDASVTRRTLDVALAAARERGATTECIDLRTYDLPVFDADAPDAGDAPDIRRTLRDADAVLLGSPMYHGSFASPLKTALDYCGFDEFEETTVGLLVVSGGSFPTTALEHLRTVARALDAWVLPSQVAVPDSHAAFEDGELADGDVEARLESLGAELVDYAGVESFPDRTTACAFTAATD